MPIAKSNKKVDADIGDAPEVAVYGSDDGGTTWIAIKVDASGDVQADVLSQPARDRLTDNIGVAHQTDIILNDTTAITPKFASIDVAAFGDNTIVAAVAGKKIRVVSLSIVVSADTTLRWESGAGGIALSGQMQFKAGSGYVLNYNPVGWFETASNTLLNLELSAANSIDGHLTYLEV